MRAVNPAFWIQSILVYCIPTLFAITLHEVAHGWVARRCGDDTAWVAGRITLNPLKHIDPVGTILFPLVLFVATGGSYALGYAKPVPVRLGRLRDPRKQAILVILAGPACNFLQALLWAVVLVGLQVAGIRERFFVGMAQAGVLVNLAMFAFNLLPIPPLDGGRALVELLPYKAAHALARLEPWGFMLVTLLVVAGFVDTWWMRPLIDLSLGAVRVVLSPLYSLFS
ncbi:site-2 protease family protein [Ramlibacter agri]|uniref:site-2 protease family protein n=1 Tax=Ramlibacter agri TaxID=2728837 RepID=UPI003CC9A3C7